MPSYWKTVKQLLAGGNYGSAEITMRNAFPVRQCPACGLYSRNDPTKCRQCTDVEFLRRSPFVVHDLNEDFAVSHDVAFDLRSRILAECLQKNTSFIDEMFPLNVKSMFCDDAKVKSLDVHWGRLFDNQKAIFGDDMKSLQIIRPECFDGGSWFLDAISLLSERPDVLHKVFMNMDVSSEGVYVLKLCTNGIWTPVIVDDFVPFGLNLQALHSRTTDGQLWLPLIEKAVAKICGSYEALTDIGADRDVCDGLDMLTGAPTESTRLAAFKKKQEDLWKKLMGLEADKNHSLVIVTAGDCSAVVKDKDPCYLFPRMNYEVLKVSEEGSESDRALLLRCLLDKHKAPRFYLKYTDFVQHFAVLHVCRLRSDWTEVRLEGTLPSKCPTGEVGDVPIRRLTVAEETSVDVTIYQNWQNGKPLTDLCLVVFAERCGHDIATRVNFGNIVVWSTRATQRSVCAQCQLKTGSYLITCLSMNSFIYEYGDDVKIVMAVRSPTPLLPMRRLQFTKCALTDAFIRLALVKGVPAFPCILASGVNAYAFTNNWHGQILLVENTGHDKLACVSFTCRLTEPIGLMLTRRKVVPTKDYIPPRCRKIVAVLTQEQWKRYDDFVIKSRFLTATTVETKIAGEDDSTPKFGERVTGLHAPRPMWLT